jgi:glycosyltransferase involved in cell wall biosynthesis
VREISRADAVFAFIPSPIGVIALVLALALRKPLPREFPDVTLDIVGDSAAFAKLEQLARELHLADRVTLRGWMSREHLLELFRQADLFCLPTDETEGFRQAVHEALACGLPVITTQAAIGPMLMGQGCGVILQESTPEAFVVAVRDCLSDSARYRAMSLAALCKARRYSLERLREIIRERLEQAWGPLQSVPVRVPAETRV